MWSEQRGERSGDRLEREERKQPAEPAQASNPRVSMLTQALRAQAARNPGLSQGLRESVGTSSAAGSSARPVDGDPHPLGTTPPPSGAPAAQATPSAPAPRTWKEPSRLGDREPVRNILSYPGSQEYWMPVRDGVATYLALAGHQTQQRRTALERIVRAMAGWRAHQDTLFFPANDLDKKKAAALLAFDALIAEQYADLDAPAAAPTAATAIPSTASSARKALQTGGTRSFTAGLAHTPRPGDLVLVPSVMPNAVAELPDQRKCRATVRGDGTVWTHDDRYPIESAGQWIRYVLIDAGDSNLELYISQEISESVELESAAGMTDYPTLQSHAQIQGSVIGAGDMIVEAGRITAVSNKSGTWQPRGSHLAYTLKFLARIGLIGEDAIVSGAVTVRQFLSRPDGYDVDAGDLVRLVGDAMEGKLPRA